MVDLIYVKRRKTRKIVAIATGICSVVVISMSIIAFLGKNVGTFTVNLKTNNVELVLSEKSSFKDTTTYLRVGNIEHMDTFCYKRFKTDYTFQEIDREDTSYLDHARRNEETGEVVAVPYFKYTFFVKNVGLTTAQYTVSLKINENSADPSTRKTLDDVVRVIMIEEGSFDKVYAKRSPSSEHFDPFDGKEPHELTDKEYVCSSIINDPTTKVYERLAEPFIDSASIFTFSRSNFMTGQYKRYTLLLWIEGDDAECTGVTPKEAKLKLGVEIQAYEN